MKRLLLLGIALFFLGTASAQARPFEAPEEAAYTEAVAWWGEEPTLCGMVDKAVEPTSGDWGFATQPDAPEPTCFLRIDPEVLGWYGMLCAVMRHEVGHLLGHGHVDDPTNIMDPVLSPEAAPDCFPPQIPVIAEEPLISAASEPPAAPVHRHRHKRHRHHHRRHR